MITPGSSAVSIKWRWWYSFPDGSDVSGGVVLAGLRTQLDHVDHTRRGPHRVSLPLHLWGTTTTKSTGDERESNIGLKTARTKTTENSRGLLTIVDSIGEKRCEWVLSMNTHCSGPRLYHCKYLVTVVSLTSDNQLYNTIPQHYRSVNAIEEPTRSYLYFVNATFLFRGATSLTAFKSCSFRNPARFFGIRGFWKLFEEKTTSQAICAMRRISNLHYHRIVPLCL